MGKRGDKNFQRVDKKLIPFSLKKVKTEWLRTVATALEVPEAATVLDLRLMVEGKLVEMDHQPVNVNKSWLARARRLES